MTAGPTSPGQEQCVQGLQVVQRSGGPTKDSQRGVTVHIAPAGRRASLSEQNGPKEAGGGRPDNAGAPKGTSRAGVGGGYRSL